ncbi:hypothetical protein PMG11_09615 [Penicillium brasilianum]|uniref:Uncharacterized protein n=1 Tax=Penicillium brasilianum TaxID=104259 RepID=A0A0F7TYS2_PENBI|nr:hypothetical protein PMG11_09615 [Penicillium brasilianum]
MRPETLESQALIPVISPDDAHQELVGISMKLLMGKVHKDIDEFDEWSVAIESQSFLDYAGSNWFLHTRDTQRITGDTRKYYSSGSKSEQSAHIAGTRKYTLLIRKPSTLPHLSTLQPGQEL